MNQYFQYLTDRKPVKTHLLSTITLALHKPPINNPPTLFNKFHPANKASCMQPPEPPKREHENPFAAPPKNNNMPKWILRSAYYAALIAKAARRLQF